jgi:predicted phage replisome organizer
MAESKKYYWLKLKRDFFKRHDIRIIEEMPNGKDYILFYLKLLLESIDHEGMLRFSDAIPYNEQMLSVVTNTNVDIVRSAMKIFIELNMMEIFDDQTIYMSEVEKLIGSETEWAKKKRLQRSKEDIVPKLSSICPTEIDIETEKEKEVEEEIEFIPASPTPSPKPTRHKYGMYKNVLLSDEDYLKLQEEFPHDYTVRIDRLSEYIASTGKSYKSHLATIRAWARKEIPTKEKSSNPFLDMLRTGE